ncbi:MAG: hypothetical protein B6245_20325 [Desulfobacteraceae bacterium 4572_88]|nr:MAG: hypothetical protein B6245_20325 [Desulfobacteraceae bacterium 4572_88]
MRPGAAHGAGGPAPLPKGAGAGRSLPGHPRQAASLQDAKRGNENKKKLWIIQVSTVFYKKQKPYYCFVRFDFMSCFPPVAHPFFKGGPEGCFGDGGRKIPLSPPLRKGAAEVS